MSNYPSAGSDTESESKGASLHASQPARHMALLLRGLAAISLEGVDGILTALKELETHGYLERRQLRQPNGRLGQTEYVIFEKPRSQPCMDSPCTEKPDTVSPNTVPPDTITPAQRSKEGSGCLPEDVSGWQFI